MVAVSSGKEARSIAGQNQFDLIVLDAVSMHTSGARICSDLKQVYTDCPLVHIRAKHLSRRPKHADFTIHPPISTRKLKGIIKRLLRDNPHDTISCGPYLLNRTTRILQVHGRETALNPKLATLIELFLTHPNQILDRATIMKRVWNTDYLGDMRTLYVHIRHARTVMETDPIAPQLPKDNSRNRLSFGR